MSEPGGVDAENLQEILDREEIVLAQAEIKDLLSRYFRNTSLEGLFDERPPAKPINEATHRGLNLDFIGTRIIGTDGVLGSQERELQAIKKLRDIEKEQTDIGQMIRLVDVGTMSSRQPVIEHLIVEAKGQGGGYRATGLPNSRGVVESAVSLARTISSPK